jgi:hypothetical protein
MIHHSLKLVILCVFVPLWQNYIFRSGHIVLEFFLSPLTDGAKQKEFLLK